MSEQHDYSQFPADFTGVVRVFPIPNKVMFPHVVQPLRIFEPGYCELLNDSLGDDRLIAVSPTVHDWDLKGAGETRDSEIVCLGRVVSHGTAECGEHNVLLLGMSRAVVRKELVTDRPYRTAQVSLLGDVYPSMGSGRRIDLQHHLLDCFAPFVADSPPAREHFDALNSAQMPLGILTDILSFMMEIDVTIKQALLTERNVDVRASTLVECMEDMLRTNESSYYDRPFPPVFSRN